MISNSEQRVDARVKNILAAVVIGVIATLAAAVPPLSGFLMPGVMLTRLVFPLPETFVLADIGAAGNVILFLNFVWWFFMAAVVLFLRERHATR